MKFLTESACYYKYKACRIYYDPVVAYVIKNCKVSPPSPDGKACGIESYTWAVCITHTKNYKKKSLQDFVNNAYVFSL